MRRTHRLFLLFTVMAIFIGQRSFAQDNGKPILILQLPQTHQWVQEPYEDNELWAVRYKGLLNEATHPDIELEQTNMLREHVTMSPEQIARQIASLIKSYDDTAALTLRKKQQVGEDTCLFYTITTAESTILLFYRESETMIHSVEIALSDEQLNLHGIPVWENLFFTAALSD